MPTRYQSTDLTGVLTRIDLYGTHEQSGGDNLVVTWGVGLASNEGTAIVANNFQHVLSIQGDDAFRFRSRLDAGDTGADFGASGNNNDAAGFGPGLVAETAIGDRFVARADNVAQDGNDHFIFRTTDKSLWFDADGNGGAAAVMLADLQASANVVAADILLV